MNHISVFIHYLDKTTVEFYPYGTTVVIEDGLACTIAGHPVKEFKVLEEVDVYLRPLILGGKRKKRKGLVGSGSYKDIAKQVGGVVAKQLQSKKADSTAASIGRAIGSAIGNQIGMSKMGGDAGSALAVKAKTMLGQRLQRLIGRGDYTIAGDTTVVNSLIKGNTSARSSFGGDHAEMMVEYREYIGDLTTGTVTTGTGVSSNSNLFLTYYDFNPGNAAAFPWLSQIAANYEEYCPMGAIMEFVSTTSPYNTNSAMGEVIITSQDNVTGPVFSTRQELFNTEMCTTSRLDRNLMYGIECKDPTQNWYFVSTNSTTTDANLQNFVRIYVGSAVAATFPSNSVLGELWVTYRFRFRGPIVSSSASANLLKISGDTTLPSTTLPPTLALSSPRAFARGSFSFNNVNGIPYVNSNLGVKWDSGTNAYQFFTSSAKIPALLQVNCGALSSGRVYDVLAALTALFANHSTGAGKAAPPLMVIMSQDLLPYGSALDTLPLSPAYVQPNLTYVYEAGSSNLSYGPSYVYWQNILGATTSAQKFVAYIVNRTTIPQGTGSQDAYVNSWSQLVDHSSFSVSYSPTTGARNGSSVLCSYSMASGDSIPVTSATMFIGYCNDWTELISAGYDMTQYVVPLAATNASGEDKTGVSNFAFSISEVGQFDPPKYVNGSGNNVGDTGPFITNPYQRGGISIPVAPGSGGLI